MLISDKKFQTEEFCQEYPILIEHLSAVLEHNQAINLTGIHTMEAGKVFHIEDSLAALHELERASVGTIADLGSGAGYPGIPLAIVSKRPTTLIESNQKKTRFLSDFIKTNNLTDLLRVYAGRSEELSLQEPAGFSVVTARAVAELTILLELAYPLLSIKGRLIAFKAQPQAEELEKATQNAEKLSFELISTRQYCLEFNNEMHQRQILVYEKTGTSAVKLPRRPGMATKRPLA